MIKHQLNRTVFAACVLMAFAATARAEVVQCIDDTGSITFTDLPCNKEADAVPIEGSIGASTAGNKAGSQAGNLAPAEQVRSAALIIKQKQKRGLAVDMATMEAAKLSIISKDHAAALARRQALAQPKRKAGETRVFSLVGYL